MLSSLVHTRTIVQMFGLWSAYDNWVLDRRLRVPQRRIVLERPKSRSTTLSQQGSKLDCHSQTVLPPMNNVLQGHTE